MKRIVVLIALALLVERPSLATDLDIYVPSMSSKIETMEELGLVDHEDPIEYNQARTINSKKHKVARKSSTNKTRASRQIVGLGAGE